MEELDSYEISNFNTGPWDANSAATTPDEGDPFIGSYRKLEGDDQLTEKRIIRRTVYSGDIKGEERIDYVLSNYDEEGVPTEVTIYDYDKLGDTNLDETRSYNVYDLNIDFDAESDDWKNALTDDLLVRKTVYTGSEEEEKVSYMLDTYLIDDDDDANSPNKISVYNYEGDELREVKSYYITGIDAEDLIDEDDGAFTRIEREEYLDSISVYEGEADKEKVKYSLSYFFEDETTGEYVAWERKDHLYDDGKLTETRAYDIAGLDLDTSRQEGTGVLEETAFFDGDKNHERIQNSYSLYDDAGVPQLRTDYIYDERVMTSTETYDIVGRPLESTVLLQDRSIYEGKSGVERLFSTTSYYEDGVIFKETLNAYLQNSKGKYYIDIATENTYSEDSDLLERKVTENTLEFMSFGTLKEDLNGNI